MNADIIIINGEVHTVNADGDVAQAVAVKDGLILDVGTTDQIKALEGPDTKAIDLAGRSLIPGFIDSHLHMGLLGMNIMSLDCRSPGVGSIEDIKALVREKAKTTPKGVWIRGWGYDHSKLAENRHPTRHDLDEAAPDHPVIISRACAHISVHNSMSLEMAGITKDTPDPDGGVIGRDGGEPNGVMFENAHMKMLESALPSTEELRAAFRKANDLLISEGITQIHDSGGYGHIQMEVMREMVESGEIDLKVYAMLFSFIDNPGYINGYIEKGYSTDRDSAKFRIGPVKLMIDGSSSGPTAATIEPYTSNPNDSGIMTMTQSEIDDYILRAHEAGYQVTCHAVGDKAVTAIVDAIEKAMAAHPAENRRHRIEHCAMINRELLRRIKKLGIVPVAQPSFLYEFGDGYMRNYGKERVDNMFACRSFFDNEVVCAGSSDCPVTFSDPILGMHSAVNRTTQTGQAISQGQKVSVTEALRMFTYNGSWSAFEEKKKGSIEKGKVADLAILSHSLLKHDPEKIRDIRVEMTIIDGKIVFPSRS
jgi:predicted amidohydrolase YtcJ